MNICGIIVFEKDSQVVRLTFPGKWRASFSRKGSNLYFNLKFTIKPKSHW